MSEKPQRKRRTFSAKFKQDAVDLVVSMRKNSRRQIARLLVWSVSTRRRMSVHWAMSRYAPAPR